MDRNTVDSHLHKFNPASTVRCRHTLSLLECTSNAKASQVANVIDVQLSKAARIFLSFDFFRLYVDFKIIKIHIFFYNLKN